MSSNLVNLFEDIARAIRSKTGNSDKINAQNFPQKIRDIKLNVTESITATLTQPEKKIASIEKPTANLKFYLKGARAKIVGDEVKETTIHFGTYLLSTGAQYIDTGITCLTGYKVEIDFQHEEIKDNTWFFGVGMNWEAGTYNSILYTGAGFTYSDEIMKRCIATGICTEDQSTTSYLFGRNWSGDIQPSKMRIYSCKTYDKTGKLIQELIPAISQEEGEHQGEACMFDTVTQTYFYNIGSGSFSYAEDKETKITAPVGAELSVESDDFDVNSCLYSWQEGEKKYSHTPNIDDNGIKTGNYSNSYSKTEVITIDGATELNIKVKWGTESISYDWLCIYEGKHPEYTAYSSGYIIKVGGADGEEELIVNGDSVTFAFRSDGSGLGSGYGYYAEVEKIEFLSNGKTYIVTENNNNISCVLEGEGEFSGTTKTNTIKIIKNEEVTDNENAVNK